MGRVGKVLIIVYSYLYLFSLSLPLSPPPPLSLSLRLYKSLEDYDVLRGIFSNLEGTKKDTRRALEAEERGDYLTSLNLYKKVTNTKTIIILATLTKLSYLYFE